MSLINKYSDDIVIPVRRRSKRNTRKRNTRRRNTRRRNTRKRNTRKRNTRKRNTRKRNTRKRNNKGYMEGKEDMEGIGNLRTPIGVDKYGRNIYGSNTPLMKRSRSPSRSPSPPRVPPPRVPPSRVPPKLPHSPVARHSSKLQRKAEVFSGILLDKTGIDLMGTKGPSPMVIQNPFTGEHDQPLGSIPKEKWDGEIPTSPPTSPPKVKEFSGESEFLKGFEGSSGGSSRRSGGGSSRRSGGGSIGDDQQLLRKLYGDNDFVGDIDPEEL